MQMIIWYVQRQRLQNKYTDNSDILHASIKEIVLEYNIISLKIRMKISLPGSYACRQQQQFVHRLTRDFKLDLFPESQRIGPDICWSHSFRFSGNVTDQCYGISTIRSIHIQLFNCTSWETSDKQAILLYLINNRWNHSSNRQTR